MPQRARSGEDDSPELLVFPWLFLLYFLVGLVIAILYYFFGRD